MPPAPPLDFSGIIPPEYSTQIIEEATQLSAALSLGNTIPMGTKISSMPVPKTLPKAAFVAAPGGRKPYTELMLETLTLRAEEVAAVTAIPDEFLEDSTVNLWAWVRPRLAEAIAIALDDAILFGVGAPASYPTGGIISNTYSSNVPNAIDAVDGVNRAMGAVEARGLAVSGHAADLVVKAALRGVRDETGALLLGTDSTSAGARPTMYGAPVSYSSWSRTTPDFLTGAWQYLLVGVRSDIRYLMDPSAVIADASGAVQISGFTDNVTPLKVWGRFACAIVRPVTPRVPAGAPPFARATLTSIAPAGDGAEAAEGRTRKG